MRIFSSYSRRKDAQTAKHFKVFGPGDFFKSPQEGVELTKKVMFSIISEAKYEERAKAQKGTKNDKASCM